MAIIDDIKRQWHSGSMLLRLIYINIGVFVLVHAVSLVTMLATGSGTQVLEWLAVPSGLLQLLHRPWTVVTYMFTHYSLWHILFNMLWLYWLGSVFMDYFMPKQLTGLYVLGGLGGAALYLLAYNALPHLSHQQAVLVGASASVIAIVVAVAIHAPDRKMGLLFLGDVALKWIAIVTVGIAVLGLDGGNMGGNIAHVGGALTGAAYALAIKRGTDITRPLNAALDAVVGLFKPRQGKGEDVWGIPVFNKKKGKKKNNDKTSQQQSSTSNVGATTGHNSSTTEVSEEELDDILARLKQSGYDALTDEDKEKLFRASRRRNP